LALGALLGRTAAATGGWRRRGLRERGRGAGTVEEGAAGFPGDGKGDSGPLLVAGGVKAGSDFGDAAEEAEKTVLV